MFEPFYIGRPELNTRRYAEIAITFPDLIVSSTLDFSDLALALFPVSTAWNLQMNSGRKLATCILMGLGSMYVYIKPQ